MTHDLRFPQLVAIACHDLRTPLATVHGFARTLARTELEEPASRYVEMIEQATAQMAELLEELAFVTRVAAGRFAPRLEDCDSLELALAAAADLAEGTVSVSGEGAGVRVEREATTRAIRQLARAARRHGGLDSIEVAVRGTEIEIGPVERNAAPVVTGEDVRELGAAAATEVVRALGGTIGLADDRLRIRLPAVG